MNTIPIHTKIDLDTVVQALADLHDDTTVLLFLEDLDEKMASWDFTSKAAELFVRTGLKLDEIEPEDMTAKASLARVAEFLRQAELQPHVMGDQPILTVWTDPQGRSAALTAHDLSKLIELAMISLGKDQ